MVVCVCRLARTVEVLEIVKKPLATKCVSRPPFVVCCAVIRVRMQVCMVICQMTVGKRVSVIVC